jgi:hypothetical protein
VVGVLAGNGTTQTTSGVNTQIVTALGTLTLQANGTYSYTAKSNVSGTDYFTYTIEDGDGDRTTAVLSFNVADQAQGTITGSTWVSEDGQPGQNTGDTTLVTRPLGISFTPTDNEVVTSLTLKNLPTGWKVYDGVTLLGTGSGIDFVIDVTVHPLANLKLLPPVDNFDTDVSLNISASITDPNGGLTSTINGSLAILRDAVADKPTNVSIAVTDSSGNGSFSLGESGTLQVKATFGDVGDGSESHKVEVQLVTGFTAGLSATGTLSGIPYTYNSATGLVTFNVPNATTSIDLTFNITAPASGSLPGNLVFTATATVTETTIAGGGGGAGGTEDATNNTAVTSAQTGIPSERLLNGQLVTNTPSAQSGDQAMLLTFVLDGDPRNAYSQVVVRDTQGQQGAVLADAGFNINPNASYVVGLENPLEGHKVLVTDFNLEGITLKESSGNIQIEHEDGSNKPMGVIAEMSPTGAANVTVTDSNDGGSGNNTVNGTAGHDYLFGGSGNDTLTGGDEGDILNGGIGNDTLNGGNGDDVLVWNGGLHNLAADNPNLGDTYIGGAGNDILRIDQGALFNSTINNTSSIDHFPLSDTVDLSGAHITGIEVILLTEEARISGTTQSGDPTMGTRVILDASDILAFSDTDVLYIIGSKGDKVDIDDATGSNTGDTNWVPGSDVTPIAGGVTYTQWTGTFSDSNGSHSVTLYVDKDVTVV